MSKPVIFIGHSQKDEEWKDRLEEQLGVFEQARSLEVWTDGKFGAGDDWYQKFEDALKNASVAIFMVSTHSLSSKFILKEEVARFVERRHSEGLRVIPIVINDCLWQQVKWLAAMQVRPRDGKSLAQMKRAEADTELRRIVLEVAGANQGAMKWSDGIRA